MDYAKWVHGGSPKLLLDGGTSIPRLVLSLVLAPQGLNFGYAHRELLLHFFVILCNLSLYWVNFIE